MPLTFNQALEASGIEPATVRLLRHQHRGENGRTPYTLWRDDQPLFEAYQAAQSVKNRNRLSGPNWASFVVTPDGRTLFAGLYAVQGRGEMPAEWPYPIGTRPAPGVDDLYDLRITWRCFPISKGGCTSTGARARAAGCSAPKCRTSQSKRLARRFAELSFPGFSAFSEPLSRIMGLPPTWVAALGAARGIYLLTCPRTKELYVGSATGAEWLYRALARLCPVRARR